MLMRDDFDEIAGVLLSLGTKALCLASPFGSRFAFLICLDRCIELTIDEEPYFVHRHLSSLRILLQVTKTLEFFNLRRQSSPASWFRHRIQLDLHRLPL